MKGNVLAKLTITYNGNEIVVKEGVDPDFPGVDVCLKAEAYSVFDERSPIGVDRTFGFVVGRDALAQFCVLLLEELKKRDVK